MVESEPKKMTMKERMAMFNAGNQTTVETAKPKPAVAPKKKIDNSWMNKQNETAQSEIVTENKPNPFKQQAKPQPKPVPAAQPKEEVKQTPPPAVAKVEEVKDERPAPQKRGKLDTSWLNKGNSQTEVVIPDNKPKYVAPAKTGNAASSWIKNQDAKAEETKKEQPAPVTKPVAKKVDTSWMQNKQAAQSEAVVEEAKKERRTTGGLAARFAAQQAAEEEERNKKAEEQAKKRKETMAAKRAEKEGSGDKAAFKNSLEAMLARGPGARKGTVQAKSSANIEEVKTKIKPDIFVEQEDESDEEDDPFKLAEKRAKQERKQAQIITQQALLDKPVIQKKRGNTTKYDADNFDF